MSEGQTLNASQSAPVILTIADLTVMEVQTQVSEADVGRLESGMAVYFTTLGGGERRWHSMLDQILPQPTIDNNVVLYTGEFRVDNRDGALLPEMTAQVYFITSATRDVLTVPLGALTRRADGRVTVQRVNADGSFTQQPVTIGLTSRTAAEVISGLQAGDRVVAGIAGQGISPEGVDFRSVMRRGGGFGGF
jgi:macrolide-specific efflux system membrane fusion protein